MTTHAAVDVLCVGYACLDINFKAPHHPATDEKIRAIDMQNCGGGPASNAAVAIARLGGSARFCGYLGKDSFGEAHLRELSEAGVRTETVFRGDVSTPVAAVTIKPDGTRSIIDYKAAKANVPEDFARLSDFPSKVLLLDGHQPAISIRLAEEARALGIPIVLDAGSLHDGTLALINAVDFLIASEKFARQYSQESEPRTALAALDGLCPVVAVTWGASGVYWQDEQGQHHLPAYDIEAVDTTGAGDAFHGAFAWALSQGKTTAQSMRIASATGALTCLKMGARTALPNLASVERLLGA